MTKDEWLEYGAEQGWATSPICYTHDGPVLTGSEELEFEEGNDPCIPIIRLW